MIESLNLIEKTAFLKSVDVLAAVPSEALADLASRARERHLEAGEVVFAEGEPNRGTFLVVEGTLQVRRGPALVRILQTGMAAGELWLEEGEPHEYTVVALEHAHVLHLERQDVFDSILDYPEIALALVRTFSFRVHELTQHILDLEATITKLTEAYRAAGLELPEPPELDPRSAALPPASRQLSAMLGSVPQAHERATGPDTQDPSHAARAPRRSPRSE